MPSAERGVVHRAEKAANLGADADQDLGSGAAPLGLAGGRELAPLARPLAEVAGQPARDDQPAEAGEPDRQQHPVVVLRQCEMWASPPEQARRRADRRGSLLLWKDERDAGAEGARTRSIWQS